MPTAEIGNGVITAKFHLPDAKRGYYRGTRFDWSGQIFSLRTQTHEYFGQWFPKYDPTLHDAIQGPVEEFVPAGGGLGYEEAKPGEVFLRIGVGVLRKPEEQQFRRFGYYEIADPGRWRVQAKKSSIAFTHEVQAPNGYGYRYTKTIRLLPGKAVMAIEHELRNTGKRAIETQQYNHNFFVINGRPTGPEASVRFPFQLRLVKPFASDAGRIDGDTVRYNRELKPGESVFGELEGFGASAKDYDLLLANGPARVRIQGDRPIAKIVYWSIATTLCPEPYIDLKAAPGETVRWTYTYSFDQ